MRMLLNTGLLLLSVSASLAQNRIDVNQTGGKQQVTVTQQGARQSNVTVQQSGTAGSQAVISQMGTGNQVSINQSGSNTAPSNGQPGNQVSLRVDSTQTTIIHYRSDVGPNRIDVRQDGQTTTISSPSSGMYDSTVIVPPGQETVTPRLRTPKRRHRR